MKRLLSIIGIMLFTFQLNAQDFKFGAKAGLNLSTVSVEIPQLSFGGSNAAGEKQKNGFAVGFHIGGFAELLMSNKFSVQAELLYSNQGSVLKSNDVQVQDFGFATTTLTPDSKTNLSTSYLNIPILAKYYATEKLFLSVGPQFGILLSAKSKSSGSATLVTVFEDGSTDIETESLNSPSEDAKEGFNSLNISAALGAGYFFTENLFAEARYNYGITNDAKSITTSFLGQIQSFKPKYMSSVIQVSLGYRF